MFFCNFYVLCRCRTGMTLGLWLGSGVRVKVRIRVNLGLWVIVFCRITALFPVFYTFWICITQFRIIPVPNNLTTSWIHDILQMRIPSNPLSDNTVTTYNCHEMSEHTTFLFQTVAIRMAGRVRLLYFTTSWNLYRCMLHTETKSYQSSFCDGLRKLIASWLVVWLWGTASLAVASCLATTCRQSTLSTHTLQIT